MSPRCKTSASRTAGMYSLMRAFDQRRESVKGLTDTSSTCSQTVLVGLCAAAQVQSAAPKATTVRRMNMAKCTCMLVRRGEAVWGERMVDTQGGVGVVGSIKDLFVRELGIGPVGGGDPLGFGETLIKKESDGAARADRVAMAMGVEDMIEIEHGSGGHAEFALEVAQVIGKTKAGFCDRWRCKQRLEHLQRFRDMRLKDEGVMECGKLNDMRAVAGFVTVEGGPGLGVETDDGVHGELSHCMCGSCGGGNHRDGAELQAIKQIELFDEVFGGQRRMRSHRR